VGEDISIIDLAHPSAKIAGYKSEIKFGHSKPDGPSRKFMDTTRLKLLG